MISFRFYRSKIVFDKVKDWCLWCSTVPVVCIVTEKVVVQQEGQHSTSCECDDNEKFVEFQIL